MVGAQGVDGDEDDIGLMRGTAPSADEYRHTGEHRTCSQKHYPTSGQLNALHLRFMDADSGWAWISFSLLHVSQGLQLIKELLAELPQRRCSKFELVLRGTG